MEVPIQKLFHLESGLGHQTDDKDDKLSFFFFA